MTSSPRPPGQAHGFQPQARQDSSLVCSPSQRRSYLCLSCALRASLFVRDLGEKTKIQLRFRDKKQPLTWPGRVSSCREWGAFCHSSRTGRDTGEPPKPGPPSWGTPRHPGTKCGHTHAHACRRRRAQADTHVHTSVRTQRPLNSGTMSGSLCGPRSSLSPGKPQTKLRSQTCLLAGPGQTPQQR